jgi:hypothetical protein
MCQQMGQLMAQGTIDFSGPEFLQSWIKQNEAALEISTTDGGAHAIVPVHSQTCRQIFGSEALQKQHGAFL